MITIRGNTIVNSGTAISTPADAQIEIDGNQIIDCERGIEIREPETLLGKLGLSHETPPQEVVELIRRLQGMTDASDAEVTQLAESSGLSRFLSGSADLTTVGAFLFKLSQSTEVEKVISLLTGGS